MDQQVVKVFQQKEEFMGGHFQGDILLKESETLPEVSCFNAVAKEDQLWPDATLFYSMDENRFSQSQIQQIWETAKDIQEQAPGINMIRVSENSKENCVHISVSDTEGCGTHVGKVGGIQPLTLHHRALSTTGPLLHMFLHALGLHHEHIREDRDTYIDIQWNNIKPENWKNFGRVDHTLLSHYDYMSVMHWGGMAFAREEGRDSIMPRNPKIKVKLGHRDRLSELDVERIQLLYRVKPQQELKSLKTFNVKDLFTPATWVEKSTAPRNNRVSTTNPS